MSLFLRAAIFFLIAPGLVLGWIPYWILSRNPRAVVPPVPRVLGLGLMAVGVACLLWCFRDFVVSGRGTPAPYDPPKKLVTTGLYRFVRNPMYIALVTALGGEALFFGSRSLWIYAAVAWLAFHFRVLLYEEPALRRLFGAEYETYRAAVPRWIPRLSV
jgi:protein-S-isoprenylcysteine O-methyltransferase Ste14